MTNWKKWVVVFALLILALIVVIRLSDHKKTTKAKVYQYNKSKPLHVKVDTIHARPLDLKQVYSGTFEPEKESKISSEIQGKINTISVEVGDQVTMGQPLVQLDNALLNLQLQSVEVQLEGLQADVNRYTALVKVDAVQGIQLEKAELGLRSARVQKETLLGQLKKTTVVAPFSGVVTAKFMEVGGFAAPGMPLLQITRLDQLKFTIQVPESELLIFKLNQTYPVKLDVLPNMLINGQVSMIGSKANIGNSFPVQFTVNNNSVLSIKAGMFGKLYFNAASLQDEILVPGSVILHDGENTQMYIVENGKAVLKNVLVSKHVQDKLVISEGLKPGDVFVKEGFINLYPGAPVMVK